MSELVINGGKQLEGSITVQGSKNAALPLIAASLLTDKPVTLHNIPDILDVANMLHVCETIGVSVQRAGTSVTLTATSIDLARLPQDVVGKLRGSILLLGALAGRLKTAEVARPGGDIIGARPIDVHLDGFSQLGISVSEDAHTVKLDGSKAKASEVTLQEFSVTATENIMLTAATLPGTTTIHIAAAEPHVVALGELLIAMGAQINGLGSHTITIQGNPNLTGAEISNIPDMLEAGLFILLGAATKSTLTIKNVPLDHLRLFIKTVQRIGIQLTIEKNSVTVSPSDLSSFAVQALPQPGIPTDLQAPFAVIATQAEGTSMIHDPLYEGRFKHCDELVKMGATVTVCDPHRVVIVGPTPLRGHIINSLDIRSGATLILAGLIAEGQTIIKEAEHIDRGYSQLVERLQAIGADIKRAK